MSMWQPVSQSASGQPVTPGEVGQALKRGLVATPSPCGAIIPNQGCENGAQGLRPQSVLNGVCSSSKKMCVCECGIVIHVVKFARPFYDNIVDFIKE